MSRYQRPDTIQTTPVQPNRQATVTLLFHELVGAAIPDLDGTGTVLTGRDRTFELHILERVILDVHRQVTLTAAKRDPFRDGPARQDAVPFEPKVVVEPPRSMSLDDETWPISDRLGLPERLGRVTRLPTLAILVQAHLWIVA